MTRQLERGAIPRWFAGVGTVTSVTGAGEIQVSAGPAPVVSSSILVAATSAATASTLVKRDAAGRTKMVAGSASDDVVVVSQLASIPREIPLLSAVASTIAVVGAPEEVGGVWFVVADYAAFTTAKLRAYLRTTDGAQAATLQLYDADAAIAAVPSLLGAPSSVIVTGAFVEVDVTPILTVAGGSGLGWMSARLYSADGIAVASCLQAVLRLS